VQALSHKSGVEEKIVQQLADAMKSVLAATSISHEELHTLHRRIQDFWTK
jgi:hypothetical protein